MTAKEAQEKEDRHNANVEAVAKAAVYLLWHGIEAEDEKGPYIRINMEDWQNYKDVITACLGARRHD